MAGPWSPDCTLGPPSLGGSDTVEIVQQRSQAPLHLPTDSPHAGLLRWGPTSEEPSMLAIKVARRLRASNASWPGCSSSLAREITRYSIFPAAVLGQWRLRQ